MKIKRVRKPNGKEKEELIPKLVLYASTTAIVSILIYIMTFTGPLEESMYVVGKVIPNKSAAQHDLIIKVFEFFYKRDYMLNRLEGVPISALVGIVATAVITLAGKVIESAKRL